MQVQNYSEKSFVVLGKTENYTDELTKLGGKFNEKLKCGPAWVYYLDPLGKNKKKVENFINKCKVAKQAKTSQKTLINSANTKHFINYIKNYMTDGEIYDIEELSEACFIDMKAWGRLEYDDSKNGIIIIDEKYIKCVSHIDADDSDDEIVVSLL